ncbi:MAG: T9SS type A sorting domain-containing protein [Flavobacteriales bacterium]
MKRIFTLIALGLLSNFSISQVVFQSDLSSWDASGNPTDFFGTKTNVSASNVSEVTMGANYGTSFANIINIGSGHKRLTTKAITVVPGTTYVIKMWAATVPGDTTDLRVSLYDLSNASWTSYTSYQDVIGSTVTMYVDSVVAPVGCTSLEFIISFRNTNTLGFGLDSVSISGPVSPPAALSQINLPVTFEDTTVDYTMTDFGGNASALTADPTMSGNKVMCAIKTTGAQTWAGTTIGTATGFATALPFTATDQKMTVRVWSPASGKTIRLKVEDATDATRTCETDAMTTMTGGWDTLTFDFGVPATGTAALNFTYTYDKASIFFDFNVAGAQDTFYFDDVYFGGIPVILSQIDLPVTFEDSTVDYTMTSFGGNTDSIATDPTDPTNTVMCVVKPTGAQTWSGTTVGTPSGFATAIPFTVNDTLMSVKVWSASAGTPIRLKVEDASNSAISCETEAMTVTAGGWDTLTFNFKNPVTGTPALNLTNTYDKASLFFDFGTAGAQDTFYFDNLMLGGDTTSPPPPPPSKLQIHLTVTFEDTAVDYTMTDFGGNSSTLVKDPTDTTNHVMKVDKTAGAQTWAGTTIGTSLGFNALLPFTLTDNIMSVRVWSPDSNTVVRLKVEDHNDATHTCETEATTTVNGGWDILIFDFSNEAAGTAQLSAGLAAGWVYDKASIFFDFGNTGSGKTYYFDDVRWGPAYVGTQEIKNEELSVYPNPTNNQWTVKSEDNNITKIEVYDLKGNLVYSSVPNVRITKIDATNLAPGMYMLRATTTEGVATSRIVKN